MLNNLEIGKNILRLRKGLSLTQSELSKLLGVSHQAVSKWENGECLPDIQILLKLGKVFNQSVEELLLSERGSSDATMDEDAKRNIAQIEQPDIWTQALEHIKNLIAAPSFNTWFKHTTAEYVEGTYYIYSPTSFATDWLESRYLNVIIQILEELTGESDFEVAFRTKNEYSNDHRSYQ